jgi:hypothetical protein
MSGANFLLWLSSASSSPSGQCFAAGQSGTITAPTGATGVTVEMFGGGGGGGVNGSSAGYGGGGAGYAKRSFSVAGGSSQISYNVGTGGAGSTTIADGSNGGPSVVEFPPGGGGIELTAGYGGGGGETAPGAAGVNVLDGGIPFPATSAATAGTNLVGGDAGNVAGGGGTGGSSYSVAGGTPGGGGGPGVGSGGVVSAVGGNGGGGRICFYWTYPSNVVLSDQYAANLSLSGVGGTATATYRLRSDGQALATNVSGTLVNITGQWLTSGTSSNYEVYAQWSPQGGGPGGIPGGGVIGGATPQTWLSLGTTRDFTLSATNNAVERELYIQIRNAATQEIVNFCVITVEVDSAP